MGRSSGEKKLQRREAQKPAEGALRVLSRMLMCICDEKTVLGCGMNFLGRLERNVSEAHKGLEIVPIPISQIGKLKTDGALD